MELGVCESIGRFNSGAGFSAELLAKCGVEVGSNAIAAMKSQGYTRKYSAAVKISDKARIARQKLQG